MNALSERRQAILDFIETFIADNTYPPTYEEIRRGLGLSTKSLVNHHLAALEEAGLLERDRSISRGLRLKGQNVHKVPMVGSIVAGLPVTSFAESIDTASEALLLTSDIVPPQEGLFALRVRGESMIDAMVGDGDLVIMKRQSFARDGDMVAVRLIDRDETTLKHFFREPDRIRLQPANPLIGPIYTHPRNVEVQGKVVAVIRRVN
ncbi:MAG TPA: transcriptional repressor LexA [Anaerolineae bacterium]